MYSVNVKLSALPPPRGPKIYTTNPSEFADQMYKEMHCMIIAYAIYIEVYAERQREEGRGWARERNSLDRRKNGY